MSEPDDRATEDEINRARELYAHNSDNNIEVDEEAATSRGEDGVWVAAWVWLRNPLPEQAG